MQEVKNSIRAVILNAYAKSVEAGELPEGASLEPSVEIPRDSANGDYSTNFAMACAKPLRKSPKFIAEQLLNRCDLSGSFCKSVEIAGPGFINFTLSDQWYADVLRSIEARQEQYGRIEDGAGRRAMVEFVSANPTGPMTIGNARGGVVGDAVSSILDYAGWDVHREFYLNDAGNQVNLFGRSIDARFRQLLLGEDAVEFPEDGYHGEYIRDIAAGYRAQYGDSPLDLPEEERLEQLIQYGLAINLEQMKKDLARYGIVYDQWFPETSLHESGYVRETVDGLTANGHTYEKDGALWLKMGEYGSDKDEVLVKANGFYTYFAVDLAYHRNKFTVRNFDRVIDVLGADHHGHTLRFKASIRALGIDPDRLDFLLMQLVHLRRGEEVVRMSKRTGKAITLGDLLDEIPRDAARFFFNQQKPDTHLDFDLDLATKQSSENPVYYVQYAHARICSLLKASEGAGPSNAGRGVDHTLLTDPTERELIKQLAFFPEEIHLAARDLDPSRINHYLIDLAAAFHRFYNACRILGEAEDLSRSRLSLVRATGTVLKTGLGIIGVSAPEKM